jgi:hypothetical protein
LVIFVSNYRLKKMSVKNTPVFYTISSKIVASGASRFWHPIMLIIYIGLVANCGGPSSTPNGADPGVFDVPIAYVKRPVPVDNQGQSVQADLRRPRLFSSGGDVFVRTNSTSSATAINITSSVTLGTGDVKGLNSSFDGKRIIFSLRLLDPNPNDNVIPSWNIYEYDLELNQLRRVITSDFTAEQGDDLDPAYLPDGRIVFTSSRQRQSTEMLSNEGKDRFSAQDEDENTIALVLHVMNSDGDQIHQISFNQSHDLSPVVLANNYSGQVMFSRWDNAGANTAFNLYKMNPDGSDLELLYGIHSHATGTNGSDIQFSRLRESSDGKIIAIAQPFSGTFGGGDINIINTGNFVDNDQPVWSLTGLTGPAQRSATINEVVTDGSISRNGRYSSAFPLWDSSNRLLVSKSTCQILVNSQNRPCIEPWISDPSALEVSPAYGIWLYNMTDNTEKVIVVAEQGMVITDIVAMQSRSLPNIIFDKGPGEINSVWLSETTGVIDIKSVYDFGDTNFNGCFLNVCTPAPGINSVSQLGDPANAVADQRPARFVRFVKAVALPDRNDPGLLNPPDLSPSAFGPQRIQGMREIVGYAPVEPDGSLKVKVPANVPLAISVLDKFGRRIGPRHENWIQVRPGDTTTCTGCHSNNTGSNLIHHRSDANAPSINAGLPASLIFANTRIPGTVDSYWGNFGQTMAEVRFDRVGVTVPPSVELHLSSDVLYDDVWTNPAVRALDVSFGYLHASLDISIASPASANCSPWNFKCRIVINYQKHIHPIWQIDRGVDNNANGVGDNTCTECHSNFDMGIPKVPAGQLDLSDGISDRNAEHLKAYQELLFADQGEALDAMGNVVNIQILVPVLDGNGNPVLNAMGNPLTQLIDDPAAGVNLSMSADGARRSYFVEKLTETELEAVRILSTPISDPNYIDHTGFLTGDELRLVSEWLDIGAQYFNDPFDPAAPQN